MNPTVLPLLVSLRWLAVFMVVLSHVRFMLFANFSQLNEPGPLLKLFYFLTNYGHEGYALYMLLSGVMLGGTSYRRRHAGPSAFGHFKTRLLWFYALLAPALAMGAVLDIFGSRALGASGAYAHFHEFSPAFDLGAFTANFLMVQRFLVTGLGSNAVLFILAFECWAYLSLAAYVLPGRRRLATLAATSIAVAGIALEPEFAGYLMLWLFGLVLAKAGDWPRPSRATAWLVFVGTLLISRFGGAGLAQVPEHYVLVSRLLLDLQLVLGCAVLLIASRACVRQRSGQASLTWRLTRHFPGVHVAIFATHFPFMMFVAAAAHFGLGLPIAGAPSPRAFVAFVCLVIAIYVYGFGFCRLAFFISQRLHGRPAGRVRVAT